MRIDPNKIPDSVAIAAACIALWLAMVLGIILYYVITGKGG